jgi:hypothetical protein
MSGHSLISKLVSYAVLLFVALRPPHCLGLVHHLRIDNDDRALFKIETFGFVQGGIMNITVRDFSLKSPRSRPGPFRLGFVARRSTSQSMAQEDLDMLVDRGECLLDKLKEDDFVMDMSDSKIWASSSSGHQVTAEGAGLYTLIFVRCSPVGTNTVSFRLTASFQNPGPNYLSAGDAPLPKLYLSFFAVFLASLLVWGYVVASAKASSPPGASGVHHIHYMMAVLLLLKCLTLLFEGIRYHYIAINGASEGWSIAYFVFTSLRGFMLFTVILLIGSGWSLMKPYINEHEKKIMFFVLALQVVDNVALVVLEETAPGSQRWLSWWDLLHLVDFVCCAAVLVPIVWSIRHLNQAAAADGKMQLNVARLQRFRQFYILVVCYIYFTRIIVSLLAATMPFYLLWISPLFTELATLIFYVATGYKFRPAADNPYLQVSTSDEDNDVELASR